MNDIFQKKFDRKKFLQLTGAGITSVGLLSSLDGLLEEAKAEDIAPKKGIKNRYAMVIDLRRCIGCQACTNACKIENNVPTDSSGRPGRRMQWNKVLFEEKKNYPGTERNMWARPCFHCDNPSCTVACPVKATYQDKERGLVLQNYDKCIGCKACMNACPYGVRSFNWKKPESPQLAAGAVNPDVPLRYSGIVEKCTFCIHRIKKAEKKAEQENREIRDGEITPACVLTCMGKARFFGDLNDPESRVSKLVHGHNVFRLKEHMGNSPKVFWLK